MVTEKRVTNDLRRAGTNPRRTLGNRFVLFSGLANFGGGLPITGLDRRAFCTFPGNKAVALASLALL